MTFKDKVIIITGGAGGIGLATAIKFAALDAKIVLVDMNADRLNEAGQSIKRSSDVEVFTQVVDISEEAQVTKVVQNIIDKFGKIDVIVNNAGRMSFKPIEEQTAADWDSIMGVDLYGAFFFIKEGFKNMKAGSAIINVSSIHAIETEPMVAPYAAAKAAMLSLTRSAALEGKPKGIRVNAVLPGAIDTPMLWDNPNVKAGIEQINKADVGTPADIADAIVYLSSDDAKFIQGASLIVDGGRLDRL